MSFSRFVQKPSIKKVAQMPVPVMITVLIFSCMFIVFTIESLGLSNRAKNIEMREVPIENSLLARIEKVRDGNHSGNANELISAQRFQFKASIDKQEVHNKMLYESVMGGEVYVDRDIEEFFDL